MKIRNTSRACHAIQAPDWDGPRWLDIPALAKGVDIPERFQSSPALARLLASGALVRVDGDAPSQISSPPVGLAAEPPAARDGTAGSPEDDSPLAVGDGAMAPARPTRRRSFARSLASSPSSDPSDD